VFLRNRQVVVPQPEERIERHKSSINKKIEPAWSGSNSSRDDHRMGLDLDAT